MMINNVTLKMSHVHVKITKVLLFTPDSPLLEPLLFKVNLDILSEMVFNIIGFLYFIIVARSLEFVSQTY